MIAPEARDALRAALGERVAFGVDTARLTSLRVGGPADALAAPADRAELAALLAIATDAGLPVRVLGRGFNTLVLDEGVDGVLLRLVHFRRLERDGCHLFAEAGVSHASVTRFCREAGLAGLEFGAGIPGSVGGWVAMNAGIGERETADVVREVEVAVPPGESLRLGTRALDFAYRAVRGLPPGGVVVSARLGVRESTPEAVGRTIDALLARRRATQPLDVPSCGSVFKNPPCGHAGALIDAAGLKGRRVGGAEISTRHANFIVNRGGATAADVLALMAVARDAVKARTGVELEPEVRVLGRSGGGGGA